MTSSSISEPTLAFIVKASGIRIPSVKPDMRVVRVNDRNRL
jgi:hypothetical protein